MTNIEPPEIRRTKAFVRMWEKLSNMPELPMHSDLNDLPVRRLVSRKPSWMTFENITLPYLPDNKWKNIWHRASVRNNVYLVRIRTGHGNCVHFLNLWNRVDSTNCDCGATDQTMLHIVNDCPLRKFSGGIEGVNRLDEGAIEWLDNLDLNL